MAVSKDSLMMPLDTEFISNKHISDRLYAWILLNGNRDGKVLSIPYRPQRAYKSIGICYRTFYKRLDSLVGGGYLKNDVEKKRYVVSTAYKYKRFVKRETLIKLYETEMDNIIKIYIYLSSLYEIEKKKKRRSYFRLNTLAGKIGLFQNENGDSRTEKKIKELVEKLSELGLLSYSEQKIKSRSGRPQINYIINWVEK